MTDRESKALYIAQQCVNAGMTLAGAAGVIANMEAESALRSNNLQDCYNHSSGMTDEQYTAAVDNGTYKRFAQDAYGYGLCQWTSGDRKDRMLTYFKKAGKSIGDFKTQVAFMLYEMLTFYRGVWNLCCTSNNPYECGYQICWKYETPANTESCAQYRGGVAQDWYSWLSIHIDDITPEPEPEPTVDHALKLRTVDSRCKDFPEVKLLQAVLACRNYGVAVDGIWTSELTEIVKAFQKDAFPNQPSEWDGIVGQKTWNALLERG